jgi:glycosyltransferase involved in cell wall biosynthesis
MKVSLVATVKDAGPDIQDFLASIRRQTRAPDEVVIVDGGSTDGTLEALRSTPGITVIHEPGANIARGRNVAVRAATHDVIAVTDADCVLAPDWLERILASVEGGAHVVAGFYRPIPRSLPETWAVAHIPDADEVGADWMPSSRSLAFRRDAFDVTGGYPEWLEIGEDMYLNHAWVKSGITIGQATDAVVYWRPRPSIGETWRQYERYAEGDALAGMYPERHLLRFAAYGALAAGVLLRRRWLTAALAGGAVAYAWKPMRRTWRRVPATPDQIASLIGVPAAMAFLDGAKMWGYLRGRGRTVIDRFRGID